MLLNLTKAIETCGHQVVRGMGVADRPWALLAKPLAKLADAKMTIYLSIG